MNNFPLILVCLLSVTSSCGILNKDIAKPKAQVMDVVVDSFDSEKLALVFDVQVYNPNDFELKISSLDYKVQISGRQLTEGKMNSGLKLPANGNVLLKVPLNFRLSDLFASISEVLSKRSAPYTFTGSANIGLFKIPFDKTGELKLR